MSSWLLVGCAGDPVRDERFDSALPIVVLDSREADLDREDLGRGQWVDLAMSVWEPAEGATVRWDAEPTRVLHAAGRVRGNSSREYPKKQYRLETRGADGADLDVGWFGLPAEEDWIFHAPFSDKSLMRNHLMYTWSRGIGRYAPRSVFVEVYVEDDGGFLSTENYRGVYLLLEKIKRDDGRVDIAKLQPDDVREPEVTGGYILRRDWVEGEDDDPVSGVLVTPTYEDALIVEEPDADEIAPEQRAYIEGYLASMEAALSGPDFADPELGYATWIDVDSFVDHHLLVELSRNVDGFVLSTFMTKDRGGKLAMGPIWDFNGALGNADYFGAWDPEGWHHENPDFPEDNPNGYRWYARLFEDPAFAARYRERWAELRSGPLSDEAVVASIDATAALLGEPAARNFERWQILGDYVWPNDEGAENRHSYREEVEYLESWIGRRLAWMDAAILEP